MSPAVLVLPRTKGQYTLEFSAGDKQIGCVILQKQEDGSNRPAGYWIRTLNDKKPKLAKTHRECLAVLSAVTPLCLYLEGTCFTPLAGHEAL